MKTVLSCLLLVAACLPLGANADYMDAVEKQRRCGIAGEYAQSVHQRKKKDSNIFSAERNLTDAAEKRFLDPKTEAGASAQGRITRAIWVGVFIGNDVRSSKDAYMHGWSVCMDEKWD